MCGNNGQVNEKKYNIGVWKYKFKTSCIGHSEPNTGSHNHKCESKDGNRMKSQYSEKSYILNRVTFNGTAAAGQPNVTLRFAHVLPQDNSLPLIFMYFFYSFFTFFAPQYPSVSVSVSKSNILFPMEIFHIQGNIYTWYIQSLEKIQKHLWLRRLLLIKEYIHIFVNGLIKLRKICRLFTKFWAIFFDVTKFQRKIFF